MYLKNTVGEREISLLLIDAFEMFFNPQNDGHLGSILGGLSCNVEDMVR